MAITHNPLKDYEELRLCIENNHFSFLVNTGFVNRGTYHSMPHSHDFFELFYCAKGGLNIGHDEGIIRLEVGDLSIIPSGIVHHIHTDADSLYVIISFWNDEKTWGENRIHLLRQLPVSDAFRRMTEYYFGNYQYRKTLLCACLSEILALLMEYRQEPPSKKETPANIDTDLYRRYVISNYFNDFSSKDLNLQELSQMLHLSIHQTQRITQNIYGCSFRDRLIHLRVDKAKKLLTQTALPVAKICADVGYKSIQGFLAVFKKTTGMTPSAYRKSHL